MKNIATNLISWMNSFFLVLNFVAVLLVGYVVDQIWQRSNISQKHYVERNAQMDSIFKNDERSHLKDIEFSQRLDRIETLLKNKK